MKPEPSEDLQMRILALLDGTLDEDEVARLDAELCGCREARDLYQDLALLHVALKEQAAARSGLGHVPVIPIERLLARQRRRAVQASLMAAAAVLLVSALIFHFKSVQTRVPLADFRLGPDSVFTLTHAGNDDEAPPGKVLGKGSRLKLTRGTLEAEFDSGVRCVIEAPCDLRVLDRKRVSVTEGIAWFEVPSKAAGFTVETPRFTAVDLGTEFGVVVRVGGDHELHVTKGSVEMRAGGAGGHDATLVLPAGQARRADESGGFVSIPVQAGRFTTALPEAVSIANHSFELDRNPDPDGRFNEGERADFGGELAAWTSQSGGPTEVQVGWRDIRPEQLHPFPSSPGHPAQVLSMIAGGSVLNRTHLPWSSLRAGEKITLTIAIGLRGGDPDLRWSEKTFFGLTDGNFSPDGVPVTSDTVAHSGLISRNPATGARYGDGTFVDVPLEYTVQPADPQRPGKLGILIVADSPKRGDTFHQCAFDHVRLQVSRKPAAGDPAE